MKHPIHKNMSTLRTRSLVTLIFITATLFAYSSTTFGQAPTVKPQANHLELAAKKSSILEDVYFNAEAREVSTPSSLAATQISANSIGRVLSLLFNSARVSLQTESDPMVATWTGTVTVPSNAGAKPKPKSYLQHLRGSVNKTADTRVTIFLELGGKGFVAEYPYGMKYSRDIVRQFVSTVKPGSSDHYTASILIFAERRTRKSALLVDIDSLDIDAR